MKKIKKLHADFAPSSAERWSQCSASWVYARCAEIPKKSLEIMAKGSYLHDQAQKVWENKKNDFEKMGEKEQKIIAFYIDYLTLQKGKKYKIELEKLCKTDDDLWGTCDAILEDKENIIIADLKTGYYQVPVYQNLQLACYFIGLLTQRNLWATKKKLKGAIIQPLHEKISVFQFDKKQLLNLKKELKEKIKNIKEGIIQVTPGEHCKYCPGKNVCPAMLNQWEFRDKKNFDI